MSRSSADPYLAARLEQVASYLFQLATRQEVPVHDLGMLSLFLFQAGQLSGQSQLREYGLDLRDALLHRPVKDVTFLSVLADPWITTYALKTWCQGDPAFAKEFPLRYAPLRQMQHSEFPQLHELFMGRIGFAQVLEDAVATADCLRWLGDELIQIDGLWGLEAPAAFAGPHAQNEAVGRFNLGTPHGIVGAFLFASWRGDFTLANRLRETLTRLAASYHDGIPAFWPMSEESAAAPSAWCYGDPMLGFALCLFAKTFPAAPDATGALELGLQIWKRLVSVARPINDYHFCHGHSGLVQIALRTSQLTGDESLALWARSQMAQLPAQLSGWLTPENHKHARQTSGLLSGHLGIGFVLLSLLSSEEPRWDRLFLLS